MSGEDKQNVPLRQISLRNILSYGPETPPLELRALNVLIGPNGSGKSNLIEALSLLRSAASDLRTVLRSGGGAGEWVWKGAPHEPATIDVVVTNPQLDKPQLRHVLSFRGDEPTFVLEDERVEYEKPYLDLSRPYFFYQFQHGHPVINTVEGKRRSLARDTVDPAQSILAQRRDPELYPEITHLAGLYGGFRIFREWVFGRSTVFRQPQAADTRNDRLEEDFSNLGMFLSRLQRYPAVKRLIEHRLADLYDGVTDYEVIVQGGTVQVFFTEGDFTVPAPRLSDGSLRYLCLLAILCDPDPPPLICIEEPELGLHPDIIPKVAELLFETSERTQLIVTTHSDILVDAMTEQPDAVIVCSKEAGQTSLTRLDSGELAHWLQKYRLGELWTRGELGGTRW